MRNQLAKRLCMDEVRQECLVVNNGGDYALQKLYALTLDPDQRVASNALWIFTHLGEHSDEWLFAKHDQLIDRALQEQNTTKQRLMLTLLLRQPFRKETLRTDFIDFCVSKITVCSSPYAIRALCMKLAYQQMKHYPELLQELKLTLAILTQEKLSPALSSALRQVQEKMRKLKGGSKN